MIKIKSPRKIQVRTKIREPIKQCQSETERVNKAFLIVTGQHERFWIHGFSQETIVYRRERGKTHLRIGSRRGSSTICLRARVSTLLKKEREIWRKRMQKHTWGMSSSILIFGHLHSHIRWKFLIQHSNLHPLPSCKISLYVWGTFPLYFFTAIFAWIFCLLLFNTASSAALHILRGRRMPGLNPVSKFLVPDWGM